MKIVINKSHLGGKFSDCKDCALARAINEQLEIPDANVGIWSINQGRFNCYELGSIDPGFHEQNHKDLIHGRIEEFVTEYTPINN